MSESDRQCESNLSLKTILEHSEKNQTTDALEIITMEMKIMIKPTQYFDHILFNDAPWISPLPSKTIYIFLWILIKIYYFKLAL